MKKGILLGLGILFLCCSLACVGYGFYRVSAMDADMYGQEFEIKQLNDVLTAHEFNKVHGEQSHVYVGSAKDAGDRVADYMNGDASGSVDDFFYVSSDSGKFVRVIGFRWTFETGYVGSGDTIPVTWTCRDSDGALTAYVFADYIIDGDVFKNVEYNAVADNPFWDRFDEGIDENVPEHGSESSMSSGDMDVDVDEYSDFDFTGRSGLTIDLIRRTVASGYKIPDKEPERSDIGGNYGVIDDVDVPVMAEGE
ncbi:MAG: hypothetical protein HDQ88_09590 [Clostridia bacterium]|nr:hypothetical protein [Clostridia bacterium]